MILESASLFLALAASGEASPRLVVVAPAAFHGALGAYVRHREKDLPVDLVSLESVLAAGCSY